VVDSVLLLVVRTGAGLAVLRYDWVTFLSSSLVVCWWVVLDAPPLLLEELLERLLSVVSLKRALVGSVVDSWAKWEMVFWSMLLSLISGAKREASSWGK